MLAESMKTRIYDGFNKIILEEEHNVIDSGKIFD